MTSSSLRAAGFLSLVAAVVHAGVAPSHFAEWWGFGLFFAAAAAGQAIFGLALLLDAFADGAEGRVVLVGVSVTTLIVLVYVASRTVGVPFGPGGGGREPVGPADAVATAAELGVLALLLARRAIVTRPAA